MSIDAKRRAASVAFIALLVLSVWWPSPIVSVNRLCCNASLGIDELSFLGRESRAWDVVFWCVAVLFALILFRDARDIGPMREEIREIRLRAGLAILAAAGEDAILRFAEFFTANIRNLNTRRAYARAASDVAAWCKKRGIAALDRVQPVHVASYIEDLQTQMAAPSVKLHLAALRIPMRYV